MAESTDVILKHWEEQKVQARQLEIQRATMSNMLLIFAVAGFGFVAQQGLKRSMIGVTLALIAIGVFGALASAKYYERFTFHNRQAWFLAQRLEEFLPDLRLDETYSVAVAEHRRQYKFLHWIRLHKLWGVMHLAIALTGLVTTLIIIL